MEWQPILDISTSGLRIEGRAPAAAGQTVALQVGETQLQALIVRTTEDDFAVRIDDTMEARTAMIRQVYSSRYTASVSEVRPSQLIKAVLARALR